MMRIIILCVTIAIGVNHINATPETYSIMGPIKTFELFTMLVEPKYFNWTEPNSNRIDSTPRYRYRASMRGKPNLPSWMSYQYSKEKGYGIIYGSPTKEYANKKFEVEIVCLNKDTYETRRIIVPFEIVAKQAPVTRIEMKITNKNWVSMTEKGPTTNLTEIFTKNLWPESASDLSITFMESATKLGSRVPLKPDVVEGVIVHLGSNAPLSDRLVELNEEIAPLSKLTTCTFKKTKVETAFQSVDFQIDWCTFKIVTDDGESIAESSSEASMAEKLWVAPSKDELPERNYSEEVALAIAIPSVWFAFLVALLTVVLCFQHEKLHDEDFNRYLDSLFEDCNPSVRQSDVPKSSQPVQMVQYSGTKSTPPTTTLKSLHDPYDDNFSLGSQSPSNIYPEGSPKMNASCKRPKPPAYKAKYGESSGATVHFEQQM